MEPVIVLGNGISRQGLDLNKLRSFAPIYGCNALYRDYIPDVLVATDTAISEAIQRSEYSLKHCFYTRRPIPGLGALRIPEKWWKYSSGSVALALAAEQKYDTIYLIGFDMGPTRENKFNNLYADTEFYKKSMDVPTYTGNWIIQIQEITKHFPQTQFVRVTGHTTAFIKNFENIPNLCNTPLSNFQNSYK